MQLLNLGNISKNFYGNIPSEEPLMFEPQKKKYNEYQK